MTDYNKIYSENKNAFGVEPMPIVRQALDFVTTGKVLDIGAGEGRNTLFLASKGFDVTAVDNSSMAIERIEEQAKENNLKVKTISSDINDFQWADKYNLIVITLVLHHLKDGQARELLNKAQEHTLPGGVNVVVAITKDGDFYKNKIKDADNFFVDKDELEDIYSNWDIKNYFEKEVRMLQKREDGTPMTNIMAGLLAVKR